MFYPVLTINQACGVLQHWDLRTRQHAVPEAPRISQAFLTKEGNRHHNTLPVYRSFLAFLVRRSGIYWLRRCRRPWRQRVQRPQQVFRCLGKTVLLQKLIPVFVDSNGKAFSAGHACSFEALSSSEVPTGPPSASESRSLRRLKRRTKNEPRLAVPSCHGRR